MKFLEKVILMLDQLFVILVKKLVINLMFVKNH